MWSSVDAEARRVLGSYQGRGYLGLNGDLRTQQVKRFDVGRIKSLDSAYGQASGLPADMTLFRGVDELGLAKLQPLVGEVFTEDGFMSTSLSREKAEFFAGPYLLLHVSLPAGVPGLYLDEIFKRPSEFEFLLPRGCSFLVHSISASEEAGRYSHLGHIELVGVGQMGEAPEDYARWTTQS